MIVLLCLLAYVAVTTMIVLSSLLAYVAVVSCILGIFHVADREGEED
jgi:hypothetical protein